MRRLAVRIAITLVVAFIAYPFFIALGMDAEDSFDLLAGTVAIFFVELGNPLLWVIPFAFGSVAGLLWHGIAEMLRKEYDEPPLD